MTVTITEAKYARNEVFEACGWRLKEGAARINAELGGRDHRRVPADQLLAASRTALKRLGKKSSKKAAKSAPSAPAEAAVRALVDRKIKEALTKTPVGESLTAAQAPKSAPGAGTAPDLLEISNGELTARFLTAGSQVSPTGFWLSGPDAPVARAATAASPAEADLAAMSADEFRAHAAGAHQWFAAANGYGSPIWQAAARS